MPGLPPTQTLIVRASGTRSLDPIIAALADLTEQRVLRIIDLRILAADRNGTAAAVTVEHLWWPRLLEAFEQAHAELVSDMQAPRPAMPSAMMLDLNQLKQLNELRRVGTITEAEFASAKRTLFAKEGLLK